MSDLVPALTGMESFLWWEASTISLFKNTDMWAWIDPDLPDHLRPKALKQPVQKTAEEALRGWREVIANLRNVDNKNPLQGADLPNNQEFKSEPFDAGNYSNLIPDCPIVPADATSEQMEEVKSRWIGQVQQLINSIQRDVKKDVKAALQRQKIDADLDREFKAALDWAQKNFDAEIKLYETQLKVHNAINMHFQNTLSPRLYRQHCVADRTYAQWFGSLIDSFKPRPVKS